MDTVERGESSQEVLPAWEQGAVAYSTSAGSHGGIAGAEEPRYADVVAEGERCFYTIIPLIDSQMNVRIEACLSQTSGVRLLHTFDRRGVFPAGGI